MKYREIEPNGFLNNFVKCFWYYETTDTEIQHTILPDGYFDLIAEFENETLTTVKLTGIWTKPNAPFLCIEPWCGLADSVSDKGSIYEKEGIIILEINETFNRKIEIDL